MAGRASEDRFVFYRLEGEGKLLWQFKAARPMNNAAVSRDGSLVAATSNDLSVYVLDNEGNLLWQEELGIGVQAVDIYGSGEQARVVIGSNDGLITIYSRTGRALLQTGLDYSVQSVSVTPNGSRILAGTGDGSAVLLNGANGNELWRFEAEDAIVSVALAADGPAHWSVRRTAAHTYWPPMARSRTVFDKTQMCRVSPCQAMAAGWR